MMRVLTVAATLAAFMATGGVEPVFLSWWVTANSWLLGGSIGAAAGYLAGHWGFGVW